jgi:ABC-type branched-subunit amino acid transport system substrate-binding protein
MSEKLRGGTNKEVATWIKETLEKAVEEINQRGIMSIRLSHRRHVKLPDTLL